MVGSGAGPNAGAGSSGGDAAHSSVMVREVLDALVPAPGHRVLDATLGAGGHAEAILERIQPGGRLLAIDADREMAALARRRLEKYGEAVIVAVANFRELGRIVDDNRFGPLDGALFDLGVASPQIDDPARGFSFKADGPLDMRLDRGRGQSAAQVIAEIPEKDLERVLSQYGEEPAARRIARAVVEARSRSRIVSTLELREIVSRAVPSAGRGGRIDPATRTFQALRIFVNDELGSLERGLEAAYERLKPGSRLVAISFHSLEDRVVKNFFKGKGRGDRADINEGKPLSPLPEEVSRNRRSRSARLRYLTRRAG